MRIGIDARLIAYRAGGISTYIEGLIHALAAIGPTEDFVVLESRRAQQSITPPGMRRAVLWTPCHHRFERTALSIELARLRLDVLHTTDFIPPRHGARRHIASVHDLTFWHYPQHLTAESRRYYNGQIERAVKQADHLLTISEFSKADIVQTLGVPAAKITVHLPGVSPRFHPVTGDEMATWRDQLSLPERYFLHVGTLEPRKNIIGLLDAYALLSAHRANLPPLVLAGSRGWLYEDTLAHIERTGLTTRVQLREKLPAEAFPPLYSGALALIMPSFYEGFGLPPLEAMACGTLPIVSRRSSLPEVVGDVGALIDPDDPATIAAAMERALDDPAWRGAQQAAGLKRAAGFRWETMARIALNTYLQVANS